MAQKLKKATFENGDIAQIVGAFMTVQRHEIKDIDFGFAFIELYEKFDKINKTNKKVIENMIKYTDEEKKIQEKVQFLHLKLNESNKKETEDELKTLERENKEIFDSLTLKTKEHNELIKNLNTTTVEVSFIPLDKTKLPMPMEFGALAYFKKLCF